MQGSQEMRLGEISLEGRFPEEFVSVFNKATYL
jgi:hypothetical protein